MNKPSVNLICASLLTGVYDVNRNNLVATDEFSLVKEWYDSIVGLRLNAVIFHNNFSRDTIDTYENEWVRFVEVAYDTAYNPNVFRYFVYKNFLEQEGASVENIFMTDIADVVVLQNPFSHNFFLQNPEALFCGDEPKILNNEWMNDHSTHLRNQIPSFATYEKENGEQVLLNCGVIGGNVTIIKPLLDSLVSIHRNYTISNQSAYTLDMGAFNFVARTQFAGQLLHGSPVNTVFKAYEAEREDCWFRHK